MSGLSSRSTKALSDITVFGKYAKYLPAEQRRETWTDLCIRNAEMHVRKYPHMEDQIWERYANYVMPKKVFPSMRSLQFAGAPIELANNRIFNCAFLPVEHPDAFSETMFMLLGGTGLGYSVQQRHVGKLPVVRARQAETRKYLIGDSIEGWADAVKVLVESFFYAKHTPVFDYRDIREKGAALVTTGGKAPGPEPLRVCLQLLEKKFSEVEGKQLTPIQAHDIQCIIADAVLTGGIRRAALISLFDRTDDEMLLAKSGEWWTHSPYRARANNSAILKRGEVSYREFLELWDKIKASGAGEPGIYWTNDYDWGTNPCCEIALRAYQFCNLTEINVTEVADQAELNALAEAASFLGTLQAGYTDFHYLRPIWRTTTELDALVGVGMTGIASNAVNYLDLSEAAHAAVAENKMVAEEIGINRAARVTTVKPSGTSSLVAGSSSGIHAWHAPFYIRRMRLSKNEALAMYLTDTVPQLVEQDRFVEHGIVVSFPQKAPEGAIMRSESAITLLERVKRFNEEWVHKGHVDGENVNNVSCTISLKDDEWQDVGEWMWANRNVYNGIAVLPYDGGTYIQAPFEDTTEEEFLRLLPYMAEIDVTTIREVENNTDLRGESACSGGACDTGFA